MYFWYEHPDYQDGMDAFNNGEPCNDNASATWKAGYTDAAMAYPDFVDE